MNMREQEKRKGNWEMKRKQFYKKGSMSTTEVERKREMGYRGEGNRKNQEWLL